MESMPDVLYISSDEELGLEEGLKGVDYDWIKEFLGMSDKESDDSDDVIVVHEQKPEPKSKSSRPVAKESDDDCVVLDGDPENEISSVNKSATESDELIVVGEKGQIACRDYPHPRHHCATFPFSSTPHESHCEKCHCYVCDLPAPCPKWGTGISSTDHCHATEKVEMWKIQRKNFKLKKSAPLPASTIYGNSLPLDHSQQNQVLPLGISQLSTNSISQIQASRLTTTHTIPQNNDHWSPIIHACSSSLNSTIQNQVSRANTIPMCPSTTNFTVPNGINHGRCQESASTFIRNRSPTSFVPRPGLGVRNNAFQRDRRRGLSNLRPQYSRFIISNGLGNAGGTLTVNHSAHDSSGYSNHVNPAVRGSKYYDSPGLSNDRTHNRWNNGWLPANLSSCPHISSARPSLNFNGENTVASEIQAYTQPSRLENSQSFYQSCVQGNDALSKGVACLSSNLHGNGHQIGSQIENASVDVSQWGKVNQDSCQQELLDNRGETATKAVHSFVDLVWNENSSQNVEPQIESSQPPIPGATNQPPDTNDPGLLFAGSAHLADFEDWLMEKDNALPSELNILSPDPIFCDFDASWNGLAMHN
ncbi:uncharacterized protein LOC114735110 [Neltuma alba]|uniref:uncharacterized protein LOC114717327 n=1 Tax=Neltuma alba TaxID=207710 RepID=UPI0010A4BBCE|nr:uncharacterized protein LOC114717327 [Prosopis alba]XP_028758265.1 uncharacterized protein LOC114717327 [Prosopis alba]XP_028778609.1 uncharacterized protein LOC114735110 [Prosopis alba]XP_028778617.1 uncharacterized protein LOC114735110 [Prosopis alba]